MRRPSPHDPTHGTKTPCPPGWRPSRLCGIKCRILFVLGGCLTLATITATTKVSAQESPFPPKTNVPSGSRPWSGQSEGGIEPATFRPNTSMEAAPLATLNSPTAKSLPSRGAAKSASGNQRHAVSSGSIWWTVGALTTVLIAAGITLPWLKRHIPGAVLPLPESAVQVLGRRPLEPRVSLQLVRIGTRVLVLGVGPDGARTLAEIDDPIEVDVLVGACKSNRAETSTGKSFQQFFERKARS